MIQQQFQYYIKQTYSLINDKNHDARNQQLINDNIPKNYFLSDRRKDEIVPSDWEILDFVIIKPENIELLSKMLLQI